jgi:hypothetical protein
MPVKKPGCPVRKDGDEWGHESLNVDNHKANRAFSLEEAPCGSTGFFPSKLKSGTLSLAEDAGPIKCIKSFSDSRKDLSSLFLTLLTFS